MANNTWTIIADAETVALREKAARHYPLVSAHKIARLCMKYGLRSVANNPGLLLKEAKNSEKVKEVKGSRVPNPCGAKKPLRIEFRIGLELRQQLDELASDMRCGVSDVIRQLIKIEHMNRFD